MLNIKIERTSEGYILHPDKLYKDDIIKAIDYAIDIQNEDNLGVETDDITIRLTNLRENILNNRSITLNNIGLLIKILALNLDI